MAGFNHATEPGYEIVVILDGDGQHTTHEIPVVAAPVASGKTDLVIGSRFLGFEADIPKYRVAGQKILLKTVHLLCCVVDTQAMRFFPDRITQFGRDLIGEFPTWQDTDNESAFAHGYHTVYYSRWLYAR